MNHNKYTVLFDLRTSRDSELILYTNTFIWILHQNTTRSLLNAISPKIAPSIDYFTYKNLMSYGGHLHYTKQWRSLHTHFTSAFTHFHSWHFGLNMLFFINTYHYVVGYNENTKQMSMNSATWWTFLTASVLGSSVGGAALTQFATFNKKCIVQKSVGFSGVLYSMLGYINIRYRESPPGPFQLIQNSESNNKYGLSLGLQNIIAYSTMEILGLGSVRWRPGWIIAHGTHLAGLLTGVLFGLTEEKIK